MQRHRSVVGWAALAVLLVATGCGGGDDGDGADGAGSATTTAPADGDDAPGGAGGAAGPLALLPASGPMPAGEYAVPGFDPSLVVELTDGWTVLLRDVGVLTLGWQFDAAAPPGTEATVSVTQVIGVYDTPFIEGGAVPPVQEARQQPLPDDLVGHLASIPGISIDGEEDVEVAGVPARRFELTVGDLPPEADASCPDQPCAFVYDSPGVWTTVLNEGGSATHVVVEAGGSVFDIAVDGGDGDETFAPAVDDLLAGLEIGTDPELDPADVLPIIAEGLARDAVLPIARTLTVPGSPARAAFDYLEDDRVFRQSIGQEPFDEPLTVEGEGWTIDFDGTTLRYGAPVFDGGRLVDYEFEGIPVSQLDATAPAGVTGEVAGATVTLRAAHLGPVSRALFVTLEVRTSAALPAADVTIEHVAPDGTTTAPDNLDPAASLPADSRSIVVLRFPDTEPGGTLRLDGVEFDLPVPEGL